MTAIREQTGVVAVFGASGATGCVLLARMAEQGVTARVLVRDPAALQTHARLAVLSGALHDPAAVRATLQGCQAAVCVFGPRPPYVDVFCEQATATIVAAMCELGVRRLVCQTGGMIGDYRANRTFMFQWMTDAFNRHAPLVAQDRAGQEREVKKSGLEWTLVKPPRLTDAQPRGHWQTGTNLCLGMLSSIARADLAAFLLQETLDPQYAGEAVFVRY